MKNLLIISAAVLFFSSCTKIIELDLNDDDNQRLVVDAWFTTEPSEHEVKLTLTTSYFQNEEAPKATGANVYVTDGVTQIPFLEAEPGVYKTAPGTAAQFHTNYTLHIDYNGESYEATSYVDTVADLDSLSVEPWYNSNNEFTGYDVFMWTQELPGTGDYYLWRLWVNDELKTDTLNEIYFETDQFLPDGLYFSNWNIEYTEEAVAGDTLTLEQHRISKETYDTYYAMMLETEWRGGIFDSPPANVPTNLTNGALGFFMTSAEDRMSVVVP